MKVVMLALAESMGHKPVWALQGGSDPKVTGPMVKYFQDVRKLLTSDSRRDFSHGEDLFLNWTDAAEDLASGLVDGDCIWQASHVYFFGIPEEVAPKFARDGVGNEVCYWIENGKVMFAVHIPVEQVYKHTW